MRRCDARKTQEIRPPSSRTAQCESSGRSGKSIWQIADDLGMSAGTLANWVAKDRIARGERLDPKKVGPERVREVEREKRRATDGA